jgi:tetratricopeptide (TPR) repeat protein
MANVTTVPLSVAPMSGRRVLLLLLAGVLLAAAGVGGYFAWWPRQSVVPPIATAGLDAEVVAAIARARGAVEARPKSAAAWGRLGMVLFAQDMYADCIAMFAEAERLDPTEVRWPYFRGLALILQKPEEGLAELQQAARVAPHDAAVRLRLAEESLKLDRLDEADALFRGLLAESPDNPRALLGHGQILSRRGQWQEALAPLKTAAEHPTARRSARVALAETYLRLGETAAAEAERRRAAEADADVSWPDPYLAEAHELRTGLQPRIDQTLYLLRNGKPDEAEAVIAQVLHDHPDSDEAHLTWARVLIAKGDFAEAETELRRAIQLNPNLVDGHFLLAGIQVQKRDYEAAERSYLRAIELKPTYALAHYNLGECRLQQGNKARALEAFRDAVRYRPDLAVAQVQFGALLLEAGQVEEAISHLEDAVRLDGKNERARNLLEQARAKKGP